MPPVSSRRPVPSCWRWSSFTTWSATPAASWRSRPTIAWRRRSVFSSRWRKNHCRIRIADWRRRRYHSLMPVVGRVVVCAALFVAAAAVILQAKKVNLRADQDTQFAFAGVKTWGWDVEEKGDVKMARSADDDPAAIKRQFGPTIVDASTGELNQRGLSPAAATPDLRFHYYLLVTVGVNAQVMGQFLPAVPEWGLPPFNAQTSAFSIVQTGSLVLDAVSPKLERVVWRGIAQTEIETERTDEQRHKRIREVVRELVKKF